MREFPEARSNYDAMPSFDRRIPWSEETRKLASQYVAMNADAFAKAREAAQKKRSRYPADFATTESEVDLPHLAKLKNLMLKAGLRASLAANEGRTINCAEDIRLMLGLAHTLDGEPSIASQQVRRSIVRHAAWVAERALTGADLNDDLEKSLAAQFTECENAGGAQRALIGERARDIPNLKINWFFIKKDDLATYFMAAESNILLAAQGPPKSLEMIAISEEFRTNVSDTIFGTTVSWQSKIAVSDADARAYERLAATALAIERFRHTRRELPTDLVELVPNYLASVPHDPYDGKPLRYRRLEKGYRIYSVGDDLVDDGGKEHRPPPQMSYDEYRARMSVPTPVLSGSKSPPPITYDITFTVER